MPRPADILRAGRRRLLMPVTLHHVIFWSAASCVFAFFVFFGIDLGIYEPDKIAVGFSPRAYPRMVMLLVLCASLYLVLESLLRHKRAQARTEHLDERDMGEASAKKKLLPVCAVILAYCFSISYLGFVLPSALAFALLTRLSGERNVIRMLCIGAAVAAGLYYFFRYAAAVPMPAGPFGGML
jgi:hypothetical protein